MQRGSEGGYSAKCAYPFFYLTQGLCKLVRQRRHSQRVTEERTQCRVPMVSVRWCWWRCCCCCAGCLERSSRSQCGAHKTGVGQDVTNAVGTHAGEVTADLVIAAEVPVVVLAWRASNAHQNVLEVASR